jgi:glyoxylase-like metal-dependent hydrolase (beta-lactamase superfamily II)
VLVAGFPAGSFATNCYVVAPAAGEQCLVVDPGQDAVAQLDELLDTYRLTPVAVLLTHGHVDHTWSVVPVCGARGIPAYIHPDDRRQLSDPGSGLGLPPGTPLFGGLTFAEPDDVRELADGQRIELAGVSLDVRLAPGHTPGSVVFADAGAELLFSGDLLFAGSIGRTDLPGGSYPAMLDSLVRVVTPLPEEMAVLPGHGPATTIGAERRTNPFLREAFDGAADPPGPPVGRGL